MKTILKFLLLVICSTAFGEEEGKPWPPANFTHVVAYVYDDTQDPRGITPVFEDGSLHKGIIRSTTTRLSKEQTKTLVEAVSQTVEFHESEDCYYPHHAFVFYDANWKPLGWFAVCWECGNYEASSKKFPEYIDLKPIRKLNTELGLPVYFEQESYTKLFLQEQSPEDRKGILKRKADEEAARIKKQKEDELDDPFTPKADAEPDGGAADGGKLPK